jgi:hypothetical protein
MNMALAVIRPVDLQQRMRDLFAQLDNEQAQVRLIDETRQRVKHYEDLYGIASQNIHRAIDAGELAETLEVCQWIFDYNLLRRVERG